MTEPDAPVLALVGPTASGKSGLALDIARSRRDAGLAEVEVVAVDAFTLYRGMDIATAKPSRTQRDEVAHHGIDLLDPSDEMSVKVFQRMARDTIADVVTRGRVPLLVGGSGLYFRAVVDDLRFPPTDPDLRAELEDLYRDDAAAAHARVVAQDPDAAAKIEPGNLRRSIRALEVMALTGERFSSFATAWDAYTSIYPGLTVACLEPPPDELRARIDARARRMVDAGLLDEARGLRTSHLSTTAAQAIGYAEAFAVLDGELPVEELVSAVARRTWRYARGQRSWFRRDPRCVPREAAEIRADWAPARP